MRGVALGGDDARDSCRPLIEDDLLVDANYGDASSLYVAKPGTAQRLAKLWGFDVRNRMFSKPIPRETLALRKRANEERRAEYLSETLDLGEKA